MDPLKDQLPVDGGIFYLPIELRKQMLAHVISTAPEEACGLIAGETSPDRYLAQAIFPTTNILHSPVRFRMAPKEQLDAFEQIEAQGQELIGIYHSHPNGPDKPSPTDIAEAYYPEAVHLIWSGRTGDWQCRGYLIQGIQVRQVFLIPVQ